jgi:biotin transport system permease protein
MARGVAFRYLPGNTFLHRWDARCKLVGLCSITYALVNGSGPVLGLLSGILVGVVGASNLRWRPLLRDLRGWTVLMAVVFVIQGFDTSGEAFRLVSWLPASRESLHAAVFSVWRLALILAYSALFSLVTRARDMQDALLWFMQPLPFLPARRIALMMGLVVRFLPMTLDALEEVKLANRSRLGDQVRNPLKRIRQLVIPVLRRALSRADEIAVALPARGYREDLKPVIPPIPLLHAVPLPALLAMGVADDGLSGLLLRGSQQGTDLLFNLLQRL